jgi:hypothetical protein
VSLLIAPSLVVQSPQVILNSEVWDLRSRRLLRSVPGLDGATLSFSGAGDVIFAVRAHYALVMRLL